MKDITTRITSLFDDDSQEIMSNEVFPAYSYNSWSIFTELEVKRILQVFHKQKLNRYYACIEKAKIVAEYLGVKEICFGAMMIESVERGTFYGYEYNPPLELHAWVQVKELIVDFALAGTIEKGLKTKDEVGYFLVGRDPRVLAGIPAPWMNYKLHEKVPIENVSILDTEKAKELLKTKYGNISKRF